MAKAWSLDGHHQTFLAEAGAGHPVPILQRLLSAEHSAVLANPDQFDLLHRKNDFLAEAVHTVFGVKNGEAQLQAFSFPANQFTPAEAKWLQERRLEFLVFSEAT